MLAYLVTTHLADVELYLETHHDGRQVGDA